MAKFGFRSISITGYSFLDFNEYIYYSLHLESKERLLSKGNKKIRTEDNSKYH